MHRLIIFALLLCFDSMAFAKCRTYLSVYPTNYSINNSKRVLDKWSEDNKGKLGSCDKMLSTKDNRIILNEIHLDFYSYYSIVNLSKAQANYIIKNTGATHVIKLSQAVAGGDIVLIPVVVDLNTLKQIYDFPFNKITYVKGKAGILLDLGSFKSLVAIIMTLLLPNSGTIGPGFTYFPNIKENEEAPDKIFQTPRATSPNLSIYIESIYPPFSFENFSFQGQVYGSMGFSIQKKPIETEDEDGNDLDDDDSSYLSVLNPKIVFQLNLHTNVGSFFVNFAPGWAATYYRDTYSNADLRGSVSLGFGFGYRYFFDRNIHLDWINNATRFYPYVVDNEFATIKYQFVSILGIGYYIPDMYDRFFEMFD